MLAQIEVLQAQTNLAVTENKELLAKAALEKILGLEAKILKLNKQHSNLIDEKSQLEAYLVALKEKRQEMERELSQYKRSTTAEKTLNWETQQVSISGKAESAAESFSDLLKELTGRTLFDGNGMKSQPLRELEQMSTQIEVQTRLDAIKQKVQVNDEL